MTILFSTDQIYLHGGIEKVMAEKANYFADVLGYEVWIMTTEQRGNPACYPLSEKIRFVDLDVNYIRAKSYFHPANLARVPRHYRAFRRTMKNIRPDVIISCNYAFDFYWLPFVFAKIRKLKEFHSSRYFEWQSGSRAGFAGRIRNWLNAWVESKFDRLIVLNPSEQRFFTSANTVVIPNSIALPTSKAPLVQHRAIAAGRMAPVKGFDKMIRIWKRVSHELPNWELHIFGQGDRGYVDYLKRLVIDEGLTGRVFIRDATPSLQMELLHSSLYLMTSKTECYPMVLLEALSVGVPVITFDCPTGPRHIVTDGSTGIVVPDQDEERFAKEVVLLAGDEQRRLALGADAISDAERFSNRHVMQQWVTLFNELTT